MNDKEMMDFLKSKKIKYSSDAFGRFCFYPNNCEKLIQVVEIRRLKDEVYLDIDLGADLAKRIIELEKRIIKNFLKVPEIILKGGRK